MSFVRFGHSNAFDAWDALQTSRKADASNVVVATLPALGRCCACKPQTGHLIVVVTRFLAQTLLELSIVTGCR